MGRKISNAALCAAVYFTYPDRRFPDALFNNLCQDKDKQQPLYTIHPKVTA
jgi:hypothetical protein